MFCNILEAEVIKEKAKPAPEKKGMIYHFMHAFISSKLKNQVNILPSKYKYTNNLNKILHIL